MSAAVGRPQAVGSLGCGAVTPVKKVSFTDALANRAAERFFYLASYLTDPICNVREYYWRLAVVDSLNPTAYKISNYIRKGMLCVGIVGWASLAAVTTLPGAGLRVLGSYLQKQPFIHKQGPAEHKTLPLNRVFSLLSWNICCIGAGYSITAGGVVPRDFRIDKIVDRILREDADVNCLYEMFDPKVASYVCERLKARGYNHFYFNIGPRAIGVSSGILVASKYKIHDPEFSAFPAESLVGSTKHSTKGVFSFDLESQGRLFARIYSTHLQHSAEPEFPTTEEVVARGVQMQMIVDKVNLVRDRCIVVTGDLNLDDGEYKSSSWQARFLKGDRFGNLLKTWGGEAFCARLMGQRVSKALNLDHTMVLNNGAARSIETDLVETGYDPEVFKEDALSDHAGLFSRISV